MYNIRYKPWFYQHSHQDQGFEGMAVMSSRFYDQVLTTSFKASKF